MNPETTTDIGSVDLGSVEMWARYNIALKSSCYKYAVKSSHYKQSGDCGD